MQRIRLKQIGTALGLISLVMTAPGALASGLPSWDDESGLAVGAERPSFSATAELTLSARVYHPIDEPAEVRFWISVQNADRFELRSFSGTQHARPGEPILFTARWDGRTSWGTAVKPGSYRMVVDVQLRPESAPTRPLGSGRVDVIRQRNTALVTWTGMSRTGIAQPNDATISPFSAPHESGFPFNFYYGTLHSQTAYSDGGHANDASCGSSTTHTPSDSTPAGAFAYARNTAQVDFLAVTDHNHLFNDACVGCSGAQVIQRYHDGLAAASAANSDGSFVAIYGVEWGYISSASYRGEGHINLYEVPKLLGWESGYYEVYTSPNGVDYPAMYHTALLNPSTWGAFGQFNHPSNDYGVDFDQMVYSADADDLIHTIAVISGPASGYSTTSTDTGYRYSGDNKPFSGFTTIDMYNHALGLGFHVAPVADQDVHCSNYGASTRDRTVILAASLTKAGLFDAIHNRRVYATSDKNLQLAYTMLAGGTTYYMGAGGIRTQGPVATSGSITLHTSVWDPDGNLPARITIKEPVPNNTDGSATVVATGTATPFDFTFTPSSGKHTYYVYVTMSNGDEVWSAPIWINQAGVADTTPPTAPSGLTATARKHAISLAWTAATDNVGVAGYRILRASSAAGPFSQIATTTSLSYSDSGLTTGSTWYYQVTAYDAAGNVSPPSNTASATSR